MKLVLAGSLAVASGCFIDAIGVGTDAVGGAGGSSSGDGGGAASADGGGGARACTTPEDCGPPADCEQVTCERGTCMQSQAPGGTPCGPTGDEQCDGNGACLAVDGTVCSAMGDCLSGHCVDDVCCATACDGTCEGCGAAGVCAPFAPGTDVDAECGTGVCDGAASCATGTPVNAFRYGDVDGDKAEGWLIDVGAGNQPTFAGNFEGTIDLGDGATNAVAAFDGFVARLDPVGTLQLKQTFGGPNDQVVSGIAVATDGSTYIVGAFEDTIGIGSSNHTSAGGFDVYLGQLDATTGAPIWSDRYGDGDDQSAGGIDVDLDGNVIAVGGYAGTLSFGGGPLTLTSAGADDIYVVKVAPGGAPIWARSFGNTSDQRARDVAVRSDGSIVIAGFTRGSLTIGATTLTEDASEAAFVAVLDTDGNPLFADALAGAGNQRAWTVAVGPDDELAFCGGVMGTTMFGAQVLTAAGEDDAFVAVYDADFSRRWAKSFGDDVHQECWGLAIDANGNVVASGDLVGVADFGGGPRTAGGGNDVFVAKFAGTSEHLWSAAYGDAGDQFNNGLRVGPQGQVWLVGFFDGTLDFGGPSITAPGAHDAYVAQLAP